MLYLKTYSQLKKLQELRYTQRGIITKAWYQFCLGVYRPDLLPRFKKMTIKELSNFWSDTDIQKIKKAIVNFNQLP